MKTSIPPTRREFLGASLAFTALTGLSRRIGAAEIQQEPGRIGCGGRGSWLAGLSKQHGGFGIHAT
jgi:hypothetical protein